MADAQLIAAKEQDTIIDKAIMAAQPAVAIDLNMGVTKRLAQMANLPRNPTWLKQVFILLRRNFQEHRRESGVIITSLIQTIIIAVLISTAFLQIGNTQKSTVRRQPVLFFCVVN